MEDFASAVVELRLHDICWEPFSDAGFEVAVNVGFAVLESELAAASWAEAGHYRWLFEQSRSDLAQLPCRPHMTGSLLQHLFHFRALHRCHPALPLEATPALRMNAVLVVRMGRCLLRRP